MPLYFGLTTEAVGERLANQGLSLADVGCAPAVESLIQLFYTNLVGQMSRTTFLMLNRPDRQLLVKYATDGQTTATLGIQPIIAGPETFLYTDPDFYNSDRNFKGVELVSQATNGVVTFQSLGAGCSIWASYKTDFAQLDIPSLANILMYGVLGQLLISNVTTEKDIELAKFFIGMWDDALEKIADNEWFPAEYRALEFWNDQTDQPGLITLRKRRDA